MHNSKKAYPNLEQVINIPGSHDIEKWLQAIKTIYYEESKNHLPRNLAIRKATEGWKVTEVNDFIHWLRFYEEGAHLKYKLAQNWYGNADIGYLLPIQPDVKKEEPVNIDFDKDKNFVIDELSSSNKRKIIERQRNKIIGRLDSTEKLLRSDEGQLFADKEFVPLLEAIYDLKKKIQMVNKKSSSVKLYDDMIIREANILSNKGFFKASELLYSLAEENQPAPTPPDSPTEISGNPGEVPMHPEDDSEQISGIDLFLNKLEGNIDKNTNEDLLEVIDSEDDLIVEAQTMPEPQTPPIKSPVDTKTKPLSDKPKVEDNLSKPTISKDIDKMVDSVFSNLTIEDVISKFEEISKFYKKREMPRQLAFADMMLDGLGLASFFPTLSEATNKALEANNYISTRLDDIISRLRGTLKSKDFDVEETIKSPEIEKAKKSLQSLEDKEKEKKQLRKDIELESLKEKVKETPEIDIEEDLEKVPTSKPEVPEPLVPPKEKPVTPKLV